MRCILLTALLLVLWFEAGAQPKRLNMLALKGPVKTVIIERQRVSQATGQALTGNISILPKEKLSFDKEGRITEELLYVSGDQLFSRVVYEYPNEGTEAQTSFKQDGSVEAKVTIKYKYDSAGRVIETSTFNSDGHLRTRSATTYDSQGRFLEGSKFNGDGVQIGRAS